MDRLSSLLELFSPKAEKIDILTAPQVHIDFAGDSTIALVRYDKAKLCIDNNSARRGNIANRLSPPVYELIKS